MRRLIAPGLRWVPAILLAVGFVGGRWIQPQESRSIALPLSEFPAQLHGLTQVSDERLTDRELQILRPDDYVHRTYDHSGTTASLFVAYYGRQLGGATIHSPRNCLPGSGWEPLEHRRVALAEDGGWVNRYVVEHESGSRALVYYWYQGRGRVQASEYAVKWDLLRDAVIKRRSEEAMVRLVFPLARGVPVTTQDPLPTLRAVSQAVARHLPG